MRSSVREAIRMDCSSKQASTDTGLAAEKIARVPQDNGKRPVEDVLHEAEKQLRQLMKERTEVTKRIATVKNTVAGLVSLFGGSILNDEVSRMIDRRLGPRQPGLTRICRKVLSNAKRPMSARDVCDEIQRSVPILLAHHKDPRATVNTILSRLAGYGEAALLVNEPGQHEWVWIAGREDEPIQSPDEFEGEASDMHPNE
ncbi:MAG TPA: hypothetical protein VK722_08630 [Candidatus Aquilonibacter sp.]|nr:hypothetical protein [Candidatus Aquilonibacter sp.]